MAASQSFPDSDVYAGLSDIDLGSEKVILPRGITIEGTYAHLMSPMAMAFARPAESNQPHPAPWTAVQGGFWRDITAQLHIPLEAAETLDERLEMASTVLFLARLWFSPAVSMPAISNVPFRELKDARNAKARVLALDQQIPYFPLRSNDTDVAIQKFNFVVDNFETTWRLRQNSSEFRLSIDALNAGQFVSNTALALISLWGALEAIFTPTDRELRFRVSSFIAAYLNPLGFQRRDEQKRISALYDKRSAAAHGKPKHADQDLLATFELLRRVQMEIIRQGKMPSRSDLEGRLFGVEFREESPQRY